MGGNRSRRQQQSENRSTAATDTETQRAGELQSELQRRREIVGNGLSDTLSSTRAGAQDIRDTGGFRASDIDLGGRGREGYEEFSRTGGFGEGDREAFLRRATAPVTAVYNRASDELNRRATLQGGYMPGFDTSAAKITRQSANAGAEASLSGNVALAEQVRQGRLAGLGGLERTRVQAGNEAMDIAHNRIAGQDALQRYSQMGIAALSDIDTNELRNRLQSGQMSQFDAQLLAQLASQDKPTFDRIMQGISTIGGATAGVLGAV